MSRSPSPIYNIGNGLVEIAALTALVGSATAESLTLGNRGAAGLAWAPISMFGSLSVMKACMAAATPGWLRETLGVRNAGTDAALGLSLDLMSQYGNREDRARRDLGEAEALICERVNNQNISQHFWLFIAWLKRQPGPEMMAVEAASVRWRDICAFDHFLLSPLRILPWCEAGESIKIHIMVTDPYDRGTIKGDWIGLIASTLKLVETGILWKLNSRRLCWASSVSWFYFFLCAAVLQSCRLSRGWGMKSGRVDIIQGDLPTAQKRGGDRKLLLGAPRNFRHNLTWKFIWALGCLVCGTSLVLCYVLLGTQESNVVYVWVGFQTLWLLLRSLFFHVAEGTTLIVPPLGEESFTRLPLSFKKRVLDLMFAAARYHLHAHPRLSNTYPEDLYSFEQVYNVLSRTDHHLHKHVPIPPGGDDVHVVELTFVALIGDNTLTSAAWFQGSKLTGNDLYDSCLVILSAGEIIYTVPAARALCASFKSITDIETGHTALNAPKGAANPAEKTYWYYWIPCSEGRWLHARSDEGWKILGKQRLEVLDEAKTTQKLATANLNISIRSAEDVKNVIRASEIASNALIELVQ